MLNSRTDSSYRMSLFIELLYGLAIGNGLSDAIKTTVLENNLILYFFLTIGIISGIGEWLAYHIYVSPISYRGVKRILIDITIPLIIYAIIIAPTLAKNINVYHYTSFLCLIYFSLARYYVRALRLDDHPIPDGIIIILNSCLFLVGFGVTFEIIITFYLEKMFPHSSFLNKFEVIGSIFGMLAFFFWTIFNLRNASIALSDQ